MNEQREKRREDKGAIIEPLGIYENGYEVVRIKPTLKNPSIFDGVKPGKDGYVIMPENGKYQ